MTESQVANEKSQEFKSLVKFLTYVGIGGIVAGLIHLSSILSSGDSDIRLADALFNTTWGVSNLVCAWILAKGKPLVFLFYGVTVLSSVVYSFAVGRGFNFIIVAIGLWLLWRLISLRQRGELA